MHLLRTMKIKQSAAQTASRSHEGAAPRPASSGGRAVLCLLLGSFSPVLATVSSALPPAPPTHPSTAAFQYEIPARSWAVDCASNEALVIQHPFSYLRYRLHVVDEKGDRLRDQIETPQGGVARIIQRDGRPLTPAEDAAERKRLNDLLASPSSFASHIAHEQSNKQMGVNLLRLVPDAMIWSYAPGQPQLPNQPVGTPTLVVLDFKPNPAWSAPTFESEPLTGFEVRVWIDPGSRRLVRLEGDLSHAVNIGWGILAHIYPGGTVTLQQIDLGNQRWIVQHVVEQLTIRAFMVKNLKLRLVYDTADYQIVPAMSYQQAIKILLDTPLPTH
jgi:hypothetical protein